MGRGGGGAGFTFLSRTSSIVASALLLVLLDAGATHGHQHTAPWLDESILDRGIYVELRHPRVIRQPRAFDVSVLVNNLLARGPVTVREVRYSIAGVFERVSHARRRLLPTQRAAYRRYKSILEELHDAAERRDRAAVERLHGESRARLLDISTSALRDRQRVDASAIPGIGDSLELTVEIDLLEAVTPRTLRRRVDIPVEPLLPSGLDGSWFAGDQHLHTAYSIDALFREGTHENVKDFAATAQVLGLDWIIITDHTNVDFLVWYKPYLFQFGELLAQAYRAENDYLVLYGQEMGAGSRGPFGEAAHLLAYPRTVDSTGFLPNPCGGLVFNHVNCEPEQTILDRINDRGGIAFIAHPFDALPFAFVPWDPNADAAGWAGLEIFNSDVGVLAAPDLQAIAWWHELLDEIAPPRAGQLTPRPGYPTRFPVGIGNSDAHQPARIGKTFSYARLPGVQRGSGMVPREQLMNAFVTGGIVASNGPLVFGGIQGAGTGEVATIPPGQTSLAVTLQTTQEFGPVSDYRIVILVNGLVRRVVDPDGATGFERTVVVDEELAPPDKFVTIAVERVQCGGCAPSELAYRALANPIWLEFDSPASPDPARRARRR